MLSQRAWDLIACPACGGRIARLPNGAACERCQVQYPASDDRSGQPDLRLRTCKAYALNIELGDELPVRSGTFDPLIANPTPEVHVAPERISGMKLTDGNRLTAELISYFPRAQQPGGFMLDLGCGDRDVADICACTNLEYVGMDYSGTAPDLLGDAHALPFRDNSFDFILSLAVLEHLRYPLVAMREAHRVLKPGGMMIGTVAFLEPFHMDSYYHHTHLGTFNSLSSAGFEVDHVSPNANWSGVEALAGMSLFPRLPRFATNLLTLPLRALHRLWWMAGHALDRKPTTSDNYRTLTTTGGYRFIAHKPARVSVSISPGVAASTAMRPATEKPSRAAAG